MAYAATQVYGEETQQLPTFEVNYGDTKNVELVFGSGVTTDRTSGMPSQRGWDDTTLELKWRFQDENANRPQLAYHVAVKLPTASEANGLGTGRVDVGNSLIVEKTYGHMVLFGNAGYQILGAPDQRSNVFYGMVATYQPTNQLVVGLQGYGNTPAAPGENPEFAYGMGAELAIAQDKIALLQIGRSTEGFSDLNVYAGMQFLLGPKEHKDDKDKDADKASDAKDSKPATADH